MTDEDAGPDSAETDSDPEPIEPDSATEPAEPYIGPEARDLEAELTQRRRESVGDAAADVAGVESVEPDDDPLETAESDVATADSETVRAFWTAMAYVNIGLFVVVLGLLFAAVRGRLLLGASLVAGGLFMFYRTWAVYRAFKTRDGAGDGEPDRTE